ncbi:MAG: hypothetical protein ABWX73_12820 [Marmoricola sp.]
MTPVPRRERPDGTVDTISAHAARRLNLVAAVSFVVGGSLFALGAVMAQLDVGSLVAVNLTYLVGGIFFSAGGYASIRLAPPHQRQRHSAVVLFVGTLLFAVSLVAAFAAGLTPRQSDGWIWLPDMLGCVCFLVSGHLAMLEVGAGRVRVRPRDIAWWVVAVNQVGSILFFLAGLAAFVRPATSEAIDAGLVNWGTFAGALCFAVGGVIQAFDVPTPPRSGAPARDAAS